MEISPADLSAPSGNIHQTLAAPLPRQELQRAQVKGTGGTSPLQSGPKPESWTAQFLSRMCLAVPGEAQAGHQEEFLHGKGGQALAGAAQGGLEWRYGHL